jgi:hypothetical protein
MTEVAEVAAKETGVVKLSANLPEGTIKLLRHLAEKRGTTMTEILRRAIETEGFLQEVIAKDGKVLVEDADKKIKQVVFR